MTKKQLLITIGLVAIVFAGTYLLSREREQPLGEYVDRGNRHEVAGQKKTFETKVDTQGNVTVEVKPIEASASSSPWAFELVMDTHSVELDDDMVAQSVLIDLQGNEYRPLAWDGDPPGGHHRKGVLKFQPPSQVGVVQLKIRGVGGAERIFEWKIQ